METLWLLEYISFRDQHKACKIVKHAVHVVKSRHLAMAIAYRLYDMAYVHIEKNAVVLANQLEEMAIVRKVNEDQLCYGVSFDNTKGQGRRTIKQLLERFFKNGTYDSNLFSDWSIKLSRWHHILTAPKGYRLLKIGETILETDCEYNEISGNYWMGSVSWYNVGKTIEKGYGILYHRDNGTYYHTPIVNKPLIIRKINHNGN